MMTMISVMMIGCLIVIILMLLGYQLLGHWKAIEKVKHLPYFAFLTGIHFIRSDLNFIEKPRNQLEHLNKCGKKGCKAWGVVIGKEPIILTCNSSIIKDVLVLKSKKFEKSKSLKRTRVTKADNIFLSDGDEWKMHRTLANPAFSDTNLKQNFECHMHDLIHKLLSKYQTNFQNNQKTCYESNEKTCYESNEKTCYKSNEKTYYESNEKTCYKSNEKTYLITNITRDMAALSMDVIGLAGFGIHLNSIDDDEASIPSTISNLVETNIKRALFPRWTWGFLGFQKIIDKWLNFLEDTIAHRRKELEKFDLDSSSSNVDLLSRMIIALDAQSLPFNDQHLLSNSHVFLIAGHETSLNTMSWAFYYLSRYPKYLKQIQSEVDDEMGDDLNAVITFEKVTNGFHRTRALIHEVLRLHPPAFVLSRTAVENTRVGDDGILVPKGTSITFLLCELYRDTDIWGADANEFRPERFLENGDVLKKHRFDYVPFGAGPRQCIGKKFADCEMISAIAKIVQRYDLQYAGEAPVKETISFTLKPDRPIMVKLTKRERVSVKV